MSYPKEERRMSYPITVRVTGAIVEFTFKSPVTMDNIDNIDRILTMGMAKLERRGVSVGEHGRVTMDATSTEAPK